MKSTKRLQVLGYVRVSTEDQVDFGVSLAAQRAKIVAYCDLYELELVEIIDDAGVSAKNLKRDGLRKALAAIRSGKAEGLVIAKLDRLSRSVSDWNTLIDGYFGEKAGKQLFSVADSIDTRTAAGRLVLNVLMSVAQWERETIGERTHDALQYMRSQSQRVGTVPFGYDLGSDGVELVANGDEQATLVQIAKLRAAGMSSRSIAAELSRQGLPTKNGKTQWSHNTVERILKRQAVAA